MALTHLRRPHVFELTPRQVQVLRLIEQGRTNSEIARELSISLDGAKYHVREIMAKLGVSNREEAVTAWRAQSRHGLFRGVGWLAASTAAVRAAAVAAGLVIAAGVAAGLITWATVGSGDDDEPTAPEPAESASPVDSPTTATASATPSPSGTASPAARPSPTGPSATIDLVEGSPVPLPEGLVLYYYGGRVPIEGAIPLPVLQARQAEDGLEIYELSANFPAGGVPYTASYEFATGLLAYGICTQGYCGGYGPASDDARNRLSVSNDGGVSWTDLGPIPKDAQVVAILGDGTLILSQYDAATNSARMLTWPGGQSVQAPVAEAQPRSFDGELGWLTAEGAIFDADGKAIRAAPEFPTDRQYSTGGSELLDVIWWLPIPRDASGTGYVSEVAPDGTLGRTVRHKGFDLHVVGRVDEDRVLVRRYFPPQGGIGATYILDLRDGSFREVEGLRREGDVDAYPIAVVHGAFARVEADGDCLNIREQPASDAPVLACAADGVLLRVRGEEAAAPDGSRWLPVTAPGGAEGFASADFLAR